MNYKDLLAFKKQELLVLRNAVGAVGNRGLLEIRLMQRVYLNWHSNRVSGILGKSHLGRLVTGAHIFSKTITISITLYFNPIFFYSLFMLKPLPWN